MNNDKTITEAGNDHSEGQLPSHEPLNPAKDARREAIDAMVERIVGPFLVRLAIVVLEDKASDWLDVDEVFELSRKNCIDLEVHGQRVGRDDMDLLLRRFFTLYPGVGCDNVKVLGWAQSSPDGIMLVLHVYTCPDAPTDAIAT
jgi:hypothetical protein